MLEKIKPYFNFIALAFGAILFILLCRGYLHHYGTRVDEVRNQFEQVGRNQQEQRAGIEQVEKSVGVVAGRVDEAKLSVERIESGQRSAGSLIADCKQILSDVRQRGKTNTH